MKKILKKNLFFILSFLFLVSVFFINTYKYLNNAHNLEKKDLEIREKCDKNNISEEMLEFCKDVQKQPIYKIDFYSMLFSTFSQGYYYIVFIIFLLIVVPSISCVCRFLKNNILKNVLTRESYRKAIYKLFAEAYKSTLLLPLLTIVAFIVCYISTGSFDFNNAVQGGTVSWNINSMMNPFLFMLTYVFRIFIISIIYVNICLIVCRKNHNFAISSILSYLCFIAIEIFLEVVGNMLIFNVILKSGFGVVLNILSIFSLYDYYGLIYSIIVPLIFLIVSSLFVFYKYKNKEKLIIDCEKNN